MGKQLNSRHNTFLDVGFYKSLKFDDHLEQKFQNHYFKESILTVRGGLLLALLLYSAFGVLDIWIVPVTKKMAWMIRYLIIDPVLIFVFILSYTRFFKRYMQLIISIVAVVMGFGIIGMIVVSRVEEPGYYYYYSGLMLVIMWAYALVRLTFFYATLSSLVITVGYQIVAIFKQDLLHIDRLPIFINNNFFFLSASIIGMLAAYTIEVFIRRDFIQRQEIIIEKENTENAKNELDIAVGELEVANDSLIQTNQELNIARLTANRDMDMATNVQSLFLPRETPESEDWEVSYYFKPMSGVSGDFYDFYVIDDTFAGISLFDVSGHGIASGLISMVAKSIILRSFEMGYKKKYGLNDILNYANGLLNNEIGNLNNFITGVLMRFNKNSIEYVNAAHPPIILKSELGCDVIGSDDVYGSILGCPQIDSVYKVVTLDINEGDSLIIYSDGLIESTNNDEKVLGTQGLVDLVEKCNCQSSSEYLDLIVQGFNDFIGDSQLDDDLSVLVLRKK